MDIKKIIGARLLEARMASGLTLKMLAEKTGTLKPARISNYEQGIRMPGPTEAQLLGAVLGISPSYLLGLTNETNSASTLKLTRIPKIVPRITFQDAILFQNATEDDLPGLMTQINAQEEIPITETLSQKIGSLAFALLVEDNSLAPEFKQNECIIIDPSRKPKPGDYVLALLSKNKTILFRKYTECGLDPKGDLIFNLVPLNPDWVKITVQNNEGVILGVLVEQRRHF